MNGKDFSFLFLLLDLGIVNKLLRLGQFLLLQKAQPETNLK